jgi:hypothetical protein
MPEDGFDGELQAWDSLGCQRLATPGPLDRSLRSMSGLGVDFDGLFGQADELDPIIGRNNLPRPSDRTQKRWSNASGPVSTLFLTWQLARRLRSSIPERRETPEIILSELLWIRFVCDS